MRWIFVKIKQREMYIREVVKEDINDEGNIKLTSWYFGNHMLISLNI